MDETQMSYSWKVHRYHIHGRDARRSDSPAASTGGVAWSQARIGDPASPLAAAQHRQALEINQLHEIPLGMINVAFGSIFLTFRFSCLSRLSTISGFCSLPLSNYFFRQIYLFDVKKIYLCFSLSLLRSVCCSLYVVFFFSPIVGMSVSSVVADQSTRAALLIPRL